MVKTCPTCGARNRSEQDVCQSCRLHLGRDVEYIPTPEEIRRACEEIRAEHRHYMLHIRTESHLGSPRLVKVVSTRNIPIR